MILDRIENWALYFEPGSRVAQGMRFLTHHLDPQPQDGRVDIDGDNIFALIQSYETRPADQCRFESHRVYLDIQYIVHGGEIMGWAPTDELKTDDPYDTQKDVAFYHSPRHYTTLEVFAGNFALFYPGDAHQPGMQLQGHSRVCKVVVKIRL